MPSQIEKFLRERGVAAQPPDRPLVTYPKYWERTTRWLAAAAQAGAIVKAHGSTAALEILNLAIGAPAFSVDHRFIPQLERHGKYGFILLPGGCEWALKKDAGGQCEFCEFQEVVDFLAGDLPFSREEFMAVFRTGLAATRGSDILNVFTAGSFLNPGEIPTECQEGIVSAVAASHSISILRIESRVQYVVEETVAPLVPILSAGGQALDIAIGFETLDDHLRNKVLRKGMSRGQFERAVGTAKRLGARVSAYVLLMPVDLAEGFAVKECVESIRYAFSVGVDEVLLQARYSHREEARCPWLWSIVEVLRQTSSLGPVMLGKWEGELPEPKVWPKNCDLCTPLVMSVLESWRDGLKSSSIAEDRLPTCGCKSDWRQAMLDVSPPKRVLPTAG